MSSSSSSSSTSRGLLVALEGADRVGKTTQLLKFSERGIPTMRFPDRNSALTGESINRYLTGKTTASPHSSHMLFTVNRWEKVPEMLQILQSGKDLVLDRYVHSGVAYSMALGIDEDWAWCTQLELPMPDLHIHLRLDGDAAAQRSGYGQEVLETQLIQQSVRERYNRWSKNDHYGKWVIIDANQSVNEVHQQIVAAIEEARKCIRPALQNW